MQVERSALNLSTESGRRASNTLVTYPVLGNNSPKGELIPDGLERVKFKWYRRGLGPISLLVG